MLPLLAPVISTGLALAAEPAPAPVPGPGVETPPVVHITTDPLLPQKYRTVKAGKYTCSVVIQVSKEGKALDVSPTECDQESFWALATAILQWEFDPATKDGVAVDGTLPYTNVFDITTLLPRKHVVGFVGAAVSAGGSGYGGLEGRIHLGERLAFSGGVDLDRDTYIATDDQVWTPVFRGDFTLSSRRQYSDHRGIYGLTVGGFGDALGTAGTYVAFRGELMSPVPGLSFGGDAGVAMLWGRPPIYTNLGIWGENPTTPIAPWLRLSVIWYAPVPRDQFVVIPRPDDPVVYEPIVEQPPEVPDLDGHAFDGIPSVHWSEIEPSYGDNTPTGPAFDVYPPGSYACNVRAAISPEGKPVMVRVEKCPAAGKADAKANVESWEWPQRPGKPVVQSVFPAPIFVQHDDAAQLAATSVRLLEGGTATPLARNVATPSVWVHALVPPVWGSTPPTRDCFVDVDLDVNGTLMQAKWVSGDIEVQPRVMETLRSWHFYPVSIDGELAPVRARVSMCGYSR